MITLALLRKYKALKTIFFVGGFVLTFLNLDPLTQLKPGPIQIWIHKTELTNLRQKVIKDVLPDVLDKIYFRYDNFSPLEKL